MASTSHTVISTVLGCCSIFVTHQTRLSKSFISVASSSYCDPRVEKSILSLHRVAERVVCALSRRSQLSSVERLQIQHQQLQIQQQQVLLQQQQLELELQRQQLLVQQQQMLQQQPVQLSSQFPPPYSAPVDNKN
ncbi:hypothetical protein J6590_011951 [Homalodisca vitripennis]|nr:hypothetical protein J6590_011951 [Homalodisca vitripennis]